MRDSHVGPYANLLSEADEGGPGLTAVSICGIIDIPTYLLALRAYLGIPLKGSPTYCCGLHIRRWKGCSTFLPSGETLPSLLRFLTLAPAS